MLQTRVGYIEKEEFYKHVGWGIQKKKKNATNTSRVYRKRRGMQQTCWVGYIEQEEEFNKHVGWGI